MDRPTTGGRRQEARPSEREREMEASSSRSRSGSLPSKRRSGGGGGGGGGSGYGLTGQSLNDDTLRSIFSRVDDHFDLAHCSAVCKSCTAHVMKDLYYKRNPQARGSSSTISVKSYFEALAMNEHASTLARGSAEVHQWIGHDMRATLCRMKSGSVLTGMGDKVLRLWSAESCKYMNEYNVPNSKMLVDFDFDENKIVGLTSSQVCIWKRSGPRSIFQSRGDTFNHGLCMSYADPEVVIGCEDGRAFVYDMYSRSCSSIHRLHPSPVTCLAVTDDQLIVGGSTFGNVAIADQTSGERLGLLKSAFAPTVIRCLSFSANSHLIFAGSSSGYAHCWDLRTLRPLWETRVSPNVIYSAHHLPGDTSMLVLGGIDGVLRLVCQRTGETIRSFIMDAGYPAQSSSRPQAEQKNVRPAESGPRQQVEKKRVREIAPDARLDNIPMHLRPPITGLSVGMKKIVTTHGENYIRVWKFHS
ncbi:F-box/WD-40 repeat-containing protein At3g52030 isoform X2 [Triticum aestivum]|uniref:F-box/WD-40 repeat-containing protein At3g52030 isoform X2 n=1 Tax=Triticum aestivum TaxID=4565 RepID=UPI001D0245A1|nr:F-box/WD-40 repeat-containing protein At3g52030-like isoform X2 [Triticum aestivum]